MSDDKDLGASVPDRALVNQAAPRLGRPGFDPSREAFLAYARMLREQGVWADGCSVLTCGATTGHFVKAIAFCDRPETALALASAMSAGTAETAGLRPQAASAVGDSRDAQTTGDPS